MTSKNSIDERGSPWCNPLAWQILEPDNLFRSTQVLAVDKGTETQSIHPLGKPTWRKTSIKNGQATELNVCAISTFRRRLAHFRA
jgi:hypothetical protein